MASIRGSIVSAASRFVERFDIDNSSGNYDQTISLDDFRKAYDQFMQARNELIELFKSQKSVRIIWPEKQLDDSLKSCIRDAYGLDDDTAKTFFGASSNQLAEITETGVFVVEKANQKALTDAGYLGGIWEQTLKKLGEVESSAVLFFKNCEIKYDVRSRHLVLMFPCEFKEFYNAVKSNTDIQALLTNAFTQIYGVPVPFEYYYSDDSIDSKQEETVSDTNEDKKTSEEKADSTRSVASSPRFARRQFNNMSNPIKNVGRDQQ